MPIRMLFIYAIGFLAQFFFSARVAIQWIMSERQRRVVTPTLYWLFSLLGSLLMIVYGLFRNDFSILLGQTLTYIYICGTCTLKATGCASARVSCVGSSCSCH